MLSLIKIRVKYVIRKPCLLFWTYLFLPIFITIGGLIAISNKEPLELKRYNAQILEGTKQFFNTTGDTYGNIKSKLRYTGFLVNEQKDCSMIENVLNEFNLCSPNCSKCEEEESKFNNYTFNIIKIEKDDKKYTVDLTSRNTLVSLVDQSDQYLFKKDDLSQDLIIDPYYVSKQQRQAIPYQFETFFDLESLIARIIIRLEGKNENNNHNFEMSLGFNKYPDSYEFTNIGEITFPASFISFILTLQFSLVAYNINMRMIDEKESKLNILLERQGISKFTYMLSWLFTYLALFLFSIVSFIVLILSQTNGHIYLFVINLVLFCLTLYSVGVLFTTCIKTTKTGATAIKFYNFGSLFLGFAIVLPKTSKVTKIVFAFIPQINFYINYWVTYCLGNFENLSGDLVLLKTAKMSYIESIVMFVVDIIFYIGLSVIVQSYKDSGLPFFLYVKSFFKKVSRNGDITKEEININGDKYEKHFQELSEINRQKSEQNQCLKLVNVSKSFDDLKAVNCFNGELFSNEIFCLLGHNGAGKTTTINMISGIYDPDEGDILLDGRSLVTDKKYLYENIGLCQQEDIFFDYLTVEEHLEYMCKIKGSQVNRQEIDELITKIDLLPKKKALCSTLSGGQKRKLCIALALIGNSRIILLDEPTSGMDVMARRSLWEFLKNYKKEKIILLTTHFLDEAEYLGDRIGIMTDGQYICCGSSSYLKSKYPCGFNINLIINSDNFNENYKTEFYNEILKYEPKAEIKVASKGIFSINIQSNNQHINEIFDYIEKSRMNFGIEDYTVGSTSLEDVFLRINNKTNLGDQKYAEKREFSDMLEGIIPRETGFCRQLCAQICRSFYPFSRNKALFFFELLSGLGFVYIFIFFFSDSFRNVATKRLDLIEVLEAHKIYIYGIDKNFFENSEVYDSHGRYITLSKFDNNYNNIGEFMDIVYENAFVNIAKGSLSVKTINEEKDGNKLVYDVYNTETNNKIFGYLFANTMLFTSAFLKKEYDIKATILPDIEFNPYYIYYNI